MPTSWSSVAIVCGLVLLVDTGRAQSMPSPEARQTPRKLYAASGVWELGGSLSFQRVTEVQNGSTGNALYTVSAFPYVGWFAMQGLELGANPLGATVVVEEDTTNLNLLTLGSIAYVYRTGTLWYPFVEGFAGYTALVRTVNGRSSTADGIAWGGRAGVKLAVVERGLLSLGVQYLQLTRNHAGSEKRNGTNEISFSAGFTVWF